MKIIYIGSDSPLSLIPLNSLIKSKHHVCAVAFDDVLESAFYVANSESLRLVALNNEIQIINLSEQLSDNINAIKLHKPDVIIVSCYPRLIPQSIFSIPVIGNFNIHPSLLPKFRGPMPLFWQFREGVDYFGITIHKMTEEFDAGNIIAQKEITMQDGWSVYQATELLANMASDLILNMLKNINSGATSERIQDENQSSYQSYPTKQDYSFCTSWTAKRIYNFINAYKGSGVSFTCEVNQNKLIFTDIYSYQNKPYFNMEGNLLIQKDKLVTLACQVGYIQGEIIV